MHPATATPSPSLRERRHAETRQTIVDAAVELGIEQGTAGTTVEDIARRAGISPRTFFNHFATKRDAFLGWAPVLDLPQVALVRTGSGTLLDDLATALTEFVSTVTNHNLSRHRTLLRSNPDLRPHLHAAFRQFEQQIAEVVAARTGLPETDATVRVVAACASGAVRTAIDHWHSTSPDTPVTDVVRDHLAVLGTIHTL